MTRAARHALAFVNGDTGDSPYAIRPAYDLTPARPPLALMLRARRRDRRSARLLEDAPALEPRAWPGAAAE